MRTTLTLEHDVASALARLRNARDGIFKELVNEALRRGLRQMDSRAEARRPFRTRTADLGKLLLTSIDDIAEAETAPGGSQTRATGSVSL